MSRINLSIEINGTDTDVDIDIDDVFHEIDDQSLINEMAHRIGYDESLYTELMKLVKVSKHGMPLLNHDWNQKIAKYIEDHCDNLGGIYETERKLGIS